MSEVQKTLDAQFEEELETVDGEVVDDDTMTVSSLYGDDAQVAAMAERVLLVAPWVHYKENGQWKTMKTREVSLVIRRCMALGVDPLNPHEVQIWKDPRHGVQFQLAYTLLNQWVNTSHGGHTEPRYTPLTDEEKELEGLAATDHATWVTFVMKSDLPNVIALKEIGFDPTEAWSHFEVKGLGTASHQDWASKYFGPNARSKRWKLRKRALTDAYRMRFGTPSRQEIEILRRQRGDVPLLPQDYEATESLLPHDRAVVALENANSRIRLARQRADNGNGQPNRDPDEVLARNRELLRGSDDDAAGI